MRPTPAELIAGIRRILSEVIEPDLSSDHARTRLREVRAALAQLDWDNAGIELGGRVTRLRNLLLACVEWIDADPARSTHFGAVGPRLRSVTSAGTGASGCFDATNRHRAAQDESVAALIDPLEDWLAGHPDDGDGHAIRRKLLEHYREA